MSISAKFGHSVHIYKNVIMNVSFSKKQEEYIMEQVNSGDFQNNSEVVRDALRLHQLYGHKVISRT